MTGRDIKQNQPKNIQPEYKHLIKIKNDCEILVSTSVLISDWNRNMNNFIVLTKRDAAAIFYPFAKGREMQLE